jgi:cytochrome P450
MDTTSTDRPSATARPISDDWCAHHFDYLAPELALNLHETLATMRQRCPVAHSDEHEGYWVVTAYEDVLRVAQDWQTFSSAHGVPSDRRRSSPSRSTSTPRCTGATSG